MNISKKSIVRKGVTLALMSAMVFGTAIPAFAANEVSQGIEAPSGAERTAVIADLAFTARTYQFAEDLTNSGEMTLTATDTLSSGAGWNVTVVAGAFAYDGAVGTGTAIPAVRFSISDLGVPTAVGAGTQPVDGTGGPSLVGASNAATLETARKVVQTSPTFGNGVYTQVIDVNLEIPENTTVGTYTSTLTTSISSGVGL